jgi:carboxymethylenebutenolidase
MSITSFDNAPGSGGFLKFNSGPPRIYLTSPLPAPEKALLAWREEGYDAHFLSYDRTTQATYIRTLKTLSESLNLGENYAIIAYGDAASVVLKTAQKPLAKCCAIIAFYPTLLPTPKTMYPNSHQLQLHVGGLSQTSPRPEMCEWKLYRYEKCATGFADPSSKTYSKVEANLSWTRALACIRKGFGKNVDLEPIAQAHWNAKFEDDDPDRASMSVVKNMTQNSPHLTILPTLEGGIGRKKLAEFYGEFFVPSLVEDFTIRLVSRTLGVNRIVDEMVVSFTHSDEVDWILPGVPPTDKRVEIPMVSIVAVRGDKLVSEHMYWDQASVLVQVGLLDPKMVPKKLKNNGLKTLPVVGAEAAKQLVDPQQNCYNKFLQMHGLLDGLNGN